MLQILYLGLASSAGATAQYKDVLPSLAGELSRDCGQSELFQCSQEDAPDSDSQIVSIRTWQQISSLGQAE